MRVKEIALSLIVGERLEHFTARPEQVEAVARTYPPSIIGGLLLAIRMRASTTRYDDLSWAEAVIVLASLLADPAICHFCEEVATFKIVTRDSSDGQDYETVACEAHSAEDYYDMPVRLSGVSA